MLKTQDNDRLTQIGPGTPAGDLFRRYWQPAALASELPEKDGAPLRVRLLGEDLIAYRDSTGAVGLVDAHCPHRRAPMFFGRNEECGLRCVYHGWKFDRNGDCVDMPSEPAGTPLQAKVKIKAYPTFEGGGLVWAYMGPKEHMPAAPDYEWMRAPTTHRHVSKTFEDCNYLQAMEGGLDTAHSSFAHNNKLGDMSELRNADTSPRIDVIHTDYGYCYTSTRRSRPEKHYMRIYHYVMPFQQMRGTVTAFNGEKNDMPHLDGHIWVPIDDHTCNVYNIIWAYDHDVPLSRDYLTEWETVTGRGPNDFVPGTFVLKAGKHNDYFIDRQVQKTQTYTGIPGINTQDYALQEGMGQIVDRSKEFLGTSDKAIVAMRRMMLEATRVVERGDTPKATIPASYRNVRPYDNFIEPGADWQIAFADGLVAKF